MMNYRNAKHISAGRIDCEIEHPVYGWIPFTCDPEDTGAVFDVAALYAVMISDKKTAAYVPPSQAELDAEQAALVRDTRNGILTSTVDPIVSNPLRWAEMSAAKKTAWAAYRRALLDVPQQNGFPNAVIWPTAPEA